MHLASVCSRPVEHECSAPLQLCIHSTVTARTTSANRNKRRKLRSTELCKETLLEEKNAFNGRGTKAHRQQSDQPLSGLGATTSGKCMSYWFERCSRGLRLLSVQEACDKLERVTQTRSLLSLVETGPKLIAVVCPVVHDYFHLFHGQCNCMQPRNHPGGCCSGICYNVGTLEGLSNQLISRGLCPGKTRPFSPMVVLIVLHVVFVVGQIYIALLRSWMVE